MTTNSCSYLTIMQSNVSQQASFRHSKQDLSCAKYLIETHLPELVEVNLGYHGASANAFWGTKKRKKPLPNHTQRVLQAIMVLSNLYVVAKQVNHETSNK